MAGGLPQKRAGLLPPRARVLGYISRPARPCLILRVMKRWRRGYSLFTGCAQPHPSSMPAGSPTKH